MILLFQLFYMHDHDSLSLQKTVTWHSTLMETEAEYHGYAYNPNTQKAKAKELKPISLRPYNSGLL